MPAPAHEAIGGDASAAPPRRGRWQRLRSTPRTHPFAVAALILMAGALLLSAAHVRHYPELSPVDELQHIDYLYKAPDMIPAGETVGQEAMREQACRTLPNYPISPPCSETATYDPDDFQEEGINTAASYTPLYYTVTRAIATPLQWLTGMESLVTAGRLVGGLWLGAGLVAALAVARRLGAHPYSTAALLLAVTTAPNVLLPAATITPDAASVLAGAGLVLAVLWWEERPVARAWLPPIVALLVVLLKALNALVVAVVGTYLLARWIHAKLWSNRQGAAASLEGDVAPPRLGHVLGLGAMVGTATVVGAVGWLELVESRQLTSAETAPMNVAAMTAAFPVQPSLEHMGAFLQVLYSPGAWVTVPILGPVLQQTLSLVLFAGVFAVAFLLPAMRTTARLQGVALLAVGAVGAPLIIAFNFLLAGVYFPIPGRYALTLVPVAAAVAASSLQRQAARVLIVVAGASAYLVVLGWLLLH